MTLFGIFWQAYLGYIWQAIIGVKVPNSSHVASIQHRRVPELYLNFEADTNQGLNLKASESVSVFCNCKLSARFGIDILFC